MDLAVKQSARIPIQATDYADYSGIPQLGMLSICGSHVHKELLRLGGLRLQSS
jgi:hypothetical protein